MANAKNTKPPTTPSVELLPLTAPVDLDPSDSVLISKATMLARVNFLSFVSVWRLMQQGKFPRARIVGRRVCWLKHEVDSWIASREVVAYKDDVDGAKPPDPFQHERRRKAKVAKVARSKSGGMSHG